MQIFVKTYMGVKKNNMPNFLKRLRIFFCEFLKKSLQAFCYDLQNNFFKFVLFYNHSLNYIRVWYLCLHQTLMPWTCKLVQLKSFK